MNRLVNLLSLDVFMSKEKYKICCDFTKLLFFNKSCWCKKNGIVSSHEKECDENLKFHVLINLQ